MSQLSTNLQAIKTEKTNKIIPGNIKKGVTIFGVEGTLEQGSGSSGDVKLFKTIEEMMASTGTIGDLAIVYNYTEVPIAREVTCSGLLLENSIPYDVLTTGTKTRSSENAITINSDGITVDILTDDAQLENKYLYNVFSGNTDYVARQKIINLYYDANGYELVSTYRFYIADVDDAIWNYIKFINIDYYEMYQYYKQSDGTTGWTHVPMALTAKANEIISGKTALLYGGKVTGTLDLSTKQKIFYANGITQYGGYVYESDVNCWFKKASNANFTIGDKRYIFILYDEMMEGNVYAAYLSDNPDTVITCTEDEISFDANYIINASSTGSYMFYVSSSYAPSSNDIIRLKEFTGITARSSTAAVTLYSNGGTIITNAKIVDSDNNVIYAGGVKASDIISTSGYYNVVGEWVQGTYIAS